MREKVPVSEGDSAKEVRVTVRRECHRGGGCWGSRGTSRVGGGARVK